MKPFQFQKFTIQQSKEVFKVGTDGVLLGALCHVSGNNILEIGTGTGLISLMLAQRNDQVNILAIDINPLAVELARKNFADSIFSDRINAEQSDAKNFLSDRKFDLIVSNPPFFEDQKNPEAKDYVARQNSALTFEELIKVASININDRGVFSVIIPIESESEFIEVAQKYNFYLKEKINIIGIIGGKIRRVILQFSKEKFLDIQESTFTIEKSPRIYSDEYIELTKNFHVFKSN